MKKLLSFLIAFALVFPLVLAHGGDAYALGAVWEKKFYTDAFGDSTGEWYVANKKPFSGTYNNGDVEKARLGAEISADLHGACITLYEKGGERLKNKSDEDIEYIVQIKRADGEKAETSGTLAAGDDQIVIWDTAIFLDALYGKGKVSVYLEREDQKITNYLFTAECGNFEELFKEELYRTARQLREEESYPAAIRLFAYLEDYRDSPACWMEAHHAADYAAAEGLMQTQEYAEAIDIFAALGDYRDSAARADEARDALNSIAMLISTPAENPEIPNLYISGMTLPQDMAQGSIIELLGDIYTDKGVIAMVRGRITDKNGNNVQECIYFPYESSFSLSGTVNANMLFSMLAPGSYRYIVSAIAENNTYSRGEEILVDYPFEVN